MSEEIQQQLIGLRKLAATGASSDALYAQLLQSISQITAADAGLVWDCGQPPFRLIAEHQTQANPELRAAIQQHEHLALLESAIKRQQPILIPPRSDAPARMPVIALAPVVRNGSTEVIELFLQPNHPDTDYKFWLQTLHAYGQVAAEWNGHPPAEPVQPPTRPLPPRAAAPSGLPAMSPPGPLTLGSGVPEMSGSSLRAAGGTTGGMAGQARSGARLAAADLDPYVEQLHRSLDLPETVVAIANETRRLLQADRVSVVRRVRGRGRVVAISGQPSVNRRSATVQLLERLANRVLPLRKLFWYPPADDETLPPEIEQPLNEYLTQATSRSVVILPIAARESSGEETLQRGTPPEIPWIGGLVVEQFDVRWDPTEMAAPLDQVVRHAGSALRNAVQHRSLFLYPLWNLLGKSKLIVATRNLRWSVLIGLALAGCIAALLLIRVPFLVSCEGTLVPKRRQNIFAQVNGIIQQTLVEHGSLVDIGTAVARMKDNNLLIERQRKSGEIARLQEQLDSMRSSSLGKLLRPDPNSENPPEDNNNLLMTSIRQQIEGLRSEMAIIDQEIERLVVTSPMQGTILTWDVREQLQDKPVERGDFLMEVADVAGPWELELKLPDRRIGHLYRAQAELGSELPVTFILAAGPSQTWHGKIADVARTTDVDQQTGQWIRVTVDFDHSRLDIRQARSGVMAKINCGTRSLGYVWLNDIYEFLQAKVFFRLW